MLVGLDDARVTAQERLAGADACPRGDPLVQRERWRGKEDDPRAVLEAAHLGALGEARVAAEHARARLARVERLAEVAVVPGAAKVDLDFAIFAG